MALIGAFSVLFEGRLEHLGAVIAALSVSLSLKNTQSLVDNPELYVKDFLRDSCFVGALVIICSQFSKKLEKVISQTICTNQ